MTDGEMDRAIDAAVRQMMSVEPAADLKPRILERVERGEPRVFTWRRVAAIAAAAVLLAFVLLRLPRPAPVTEVVIAPPTPAPVASSPEVPVRREPMPRPDEAANRPRAIGHPVVEPRIQVAQTIPPLDAIDPLVVDSPRSQDIEPAEMVIAPMAAIPEVQVEPLFPELEQH